MRIVSITQEIGDEPIAAMMRKIVTLFDEYQPKENATLAKFSPGLGEYASIMNRKRASVSCA